MQALKGPDVKWLRILTRLAALGIVVYIGSVGCSLFVVASGGDSDSTPAPAQDEYGCDCLCQVCEGTWIGEACVDENDSPTEIGTRTDTLRFCAPPDTPQTELITECDALCVSTPEQPGHEFEICERASAVTQFDTATCPPETETVYSDGRTNVGDALTITLDEASHANVTLSGPLANFATPNIPISGSFRLFIDGCEEQEGACSVSVADADVSAGDAAIGPFQLSGLTLILADPAPGTMDEDGNLSFPSVRLHGGVDYLGLRSVGNLEILPEHVVSARLDREDREFRADGQMTGSFSVPPFGQLTETVLVSLRGSVANFPPVARISQTDTAVLSSAESSDRDGLGTIAHRRWFDSADGAFLGSGMELELEPGEHAVSLIVTDASGAQDRADFTLVVPQALPWLPLVVTALVLLLLVWWLRRPKTKAAPA